jgi:3-methylcrotonyl-CoA carboxylase alpha subunit
LPDSPPFRKILVANRGEIAVRIIRAIHEVGATAVSVYSDPDASALHVSLSDEAYRVGPGPATFSYLNAGAILDAARESGAEAVHPGYGFLSESAEFAEAVKQAGLVFIGPPAEVIRLMGDKVAAKRLMADNGVPLIPGYDGDDQSLEVFQREAERIGYPVMLKAAAGGGGRGMREVVAPDQLGDAIEGARREAVAAFGDGRLFLEKLLAGPRHIEVQVLGDQQGALIHLFERDCSVQRRHQKVIEEAPSPALSQQERAAICDAGLRAARAAKYVNAGTVEFLWSDGNFYFLEMNTRIQVEHGVTELVTGTDLVRAQIEIAAGRPLAWGQEDIGLDGHAIEARVYAEDPDRGFLPQFGRVYQSSLPTRRLHLRIDTALRSSGEISRFYDPMVAKLIAHGATRPRAVHNLIEGLEESHVNGVKTNISFLLWAVQSEQFTAGTATTAFLDEWRPGATEAPPLDDRWILGAVAADLAGEELSKTSDADLSSRVWFGRAGWRLGGQAIKLAYRAQGNVYRVDATRLPGSTWRISINGEQAYDQVELFCQDGNDVTVVAGHAVHTFGIRSEPGRSHLRLLDLSPAGREIEVSREHLLEGSVGRGSANQAATPGTSGMIVSPMPGTVAKIAVAEGDRVLVHQPLLVLEAMKMEHVLEAPHHGVVEKIHHRAGDLVSRGEVLIELRAE